MQQLFKSKKHNIMLKKEVFIAYFNKTKVRIFFEAQDKIRNAEFILRRLATEI